MPVYERPEKCQTFVMGKCPHNFQTAPMTAPRSQVQLMRFLCYLSIILMLSVRTVHSTSCNNRLDIVIAVDTTSSKTAADFAHVKTEVKKVVSGFTIGQAHTRLALVSISRQAHVVVNFNAVNSLSDFNAAADRLTFSTDTADLSDGIKVAKEQVLSTARARKVSKLLILMKDRRNLDAVASGAAILSSMTSQASAVTALGAAIHGVGVGGLWDRQELEALYGTEYLLFKNQNKAMDSVKSLNNKICEAHCPLKGTSSPYPGLCYGTKKHVIKSKVDLVQVSDGLSVCRKEITRDFETCSAPDRCTSRSRSVGPCDPDDHATIENKWQSFDYKLQSCQTTTASSRVRCADTAKCSGQTADIIFILDRSGSIRDDFPFVKRATETLIRPLDIGADRVRVGVIGFNRLVKFEINLGQHTDTNSLIAAVRGLSDVVIGNTNTAGALELAHNTLRSVGRPGVAKYVFVITDGSSNDMKETIAQSKNLKNDGVTLYAIGVGRIKEEELTAMTEPESATNTIILKDMTTLEAWAATFSQKMCVEVSAPIAKFCEDKVVIQTVSQCENGKTTVTKINYMYNAAHQCIKEFYTTEHQSCKSKCLDPIDGNEYIEGATWTTVCHEFRCDPGSSVPVVVGSKCLAADGSCVAAGSTPFKCRDDKGVETDNCVCADRGGKGALVIDTE